MVPVKALEYFKALGDETRLRLYSILSRYELSVNEIVGIMDMGQSRISRHLKILTDSGLLSSRRDGLWVYYTAVKGGDTEGLSRAVETLIRDEQVTMEDLLHAETAMRERDQRTRAFFDNLAGSWDGLK